MASDAICLSGYEICEKINTQYMMRWREALCERDVYKLHIMNEMRALLDAHFLYANNFLIFFHLLLLPHVFIITRTRTTYYSRPRACIKEQKKRTLM